MAKSKITSDDFLKLLNDEEENTSPIPYSPKNSASAEVKVGTKWKQSSNKVGTNSSNNWEQSGNKVATKWEQDRSGKVKSGNKVEAQPGTEVTTKWEQSSNKVGTNRDVSTIVGLQRRILDFLYQSCMNARTHHTERLPIERISHSCQTSVQSAKVTIRRLEVMGLLQRLEYKDGRGGWTIYGLPDTVHSYLRIEESGNKLGAKWEQTGSKVGAQPVTQPGTSLSSSSRDLYIKNTTTTQDVEKFEFKLDQVLEFGLTASAVSRCFELYPNLENEKMQDLLNRFAQFMRSGDGKRVLNARGFFISLAEQMSKGMTPLDHIETAEAILMRELVSKKRAQKAEQDSLEKEIQDFDFEDWWTELLPQDRDALVPPNNIALPGSSSQKLIAKQVHAEKFWPDRRVRVLKEASADI